MRKQTQSSFLLTIGVLIAGTALASVNYSACPSTPATVNSVVISANGNGCSDSDKTLSAFSITNGSSKTPSGVSQTNSSVLFDTSDTFSGPSTPFTVDAAFTPNGSAWSLTGGTGTTTQGVLNYIVDSTGALNSAYPAGGPFTITGVTLNNVAGSTGNGSGAADTVTVMKIFCIGSGACTAADEVTLTASIGNNSSTVSFACTAGASISGEISGCAANSSTAETVLFTTVKPVTLNITDTYTLVVHSAVTGAQTTDSLTSFNNEFGESNAPEPSTFLLIGTALAGVALFRLRR